MSIKSSISTIMLGLATFVITTSAATPSASFSVTAIVEAACVVSVSATTLAAQASRDALAALSVTCSHSIPYSAGFSLGPANSEVGVTQGIEESGSSLLSDKPSSNLQTTFSRGLIHDTYTVAGMGGNRSSGALAGAGRALAAPYVVTGTHVNTITFTVIY